MSERPSNGAWLPPPTIDAAPLTGTPAPCSASPFRDLTLWLASEHDRLVAEAVLAERNRGDDMLLKEAAAVVSTRGDKISETFCSSNGSQEIQEDDSTTLPHTVENSVENRMDSNTLTTDASDEVREVRITRIEPEAKTSKLEDTAVFDLRDEWLTSKGRAVRRFKANAHLLEIEEEDNAVPQETYNGFLRPFLSFPNTPKRMAWDLVGAFLILWDLVSIPLQVFDPPQTAMFLLMDWWAQLFWTANIGATLTVGFVKDGTVIMTPWKIAANYCKTWLVIDLVVVVPDWVFTVMTLRGQQSEGGESVKVLRMVRLARTFRILRLLKLKRLVSIINDLLDSEYLTIVANIIKMILILCAINHFLACGWYAMTKVSTDDNWATVYNFVAASWQEKYFVSFHWSITQFTPASMHVQPQNLTERVFAVLVVIFALVGFSYLVGSITGSLTQLRGMQEDYAKQFWNLRRFLKKNNVPLTLKFRIQRYLEHAWQKQKASVSASNLQVLQLLSEQLNNELQCAMTFPLMTFHPLFDHLQRDSFGGGVEITLQKLAAQAISRKLLARGDCLFFAGDQTTRMSMVINGKLKYGRSTAEEPVEVKHQGEDKDWIAEQILWLPQWVYLGTVVSMTEADLLQIDPKPFVEVICANALVHSELCAYAARFRAWLNGMPKEEQSDIFQGRHMAHMVDGFVHNFDSRQSVRPSIVGGIPGLY